METEKRLTTLAEYERLNPVAKGYISYMEAEQPGSELKGHEQNPYEPESDQWKLFQGGQRMAVLEVQDSEE